MFGIRYVKARPSEYLMLFRRGKIVREGAGLSGFYFAPTATLVRVPLASVDSGFIFNVVSADFQQVSVQGQIVWRVADPRKTARLLDFTLRPDGRAHAGDDPAKLPQRLVNLAQVLAAGYVLALPLREVLPSALALAAHVRDGLRAEEAIAELGLEILGVAIAGVSPTPETSRALEAEAREAILRKADEAIYARRNSAVEQERAIRENELNTEIAVEQKKRQIRETQMEAEKSVQRKRQELSEAELEGRVTLEKRNAELVALAAENSRVEADARGHRIAAVMKSVAGADPRVLQALLAPGMDPARLVAAAFRDLAEGAEKIGELNVSPELLRELLGSGGSGSGGGAHAPSGGAGRK